MYHTKRLRLLVLGGESVEVDPNVDIRPVSVQHKIPKHSTIEDILVRRVVGTDVVIMEKKVAGLTVIEHETNLITDRKHHQLPDGLLGGTLRFESTLVANRAYSDVAVGEENTSFSTYVEIYWLQRI
jgi:hypothetical protein